MSAAARPFGRLATRAFSTTPLSQLRSRPAPFRGAPTTTSAAAVAAAARTNAYTPTELDELRKQFTPAQLSALLAGDAAIDRRDFARKVERREGDPFALKYLDDLATINPILDLLPVGAVAPTRVGKDGFIIPRQNLPRIDDPEIKYTMENEEESVYKKLSQVTGFSVMELKGLKVRTITTHGVTNQTRMGKIRKIYALVVAGNGNGLLGVGEGKAVEHEDAVFQAQYMAMRNMEPIPRYEGRTIYGDVEMKEGAVEMKLFTRPPGFGVRCSSHIYEMCKCLGISDLSARVTRSRNPMNVVKTFIKALKAQKLPETIARGRGKKFVDVRKVYYGGTI